MLDRIDPQIEVPAVSAADLVLPQASEGSVEVRTRVAAARRIQAERYAAFGCQRIRTNAECDGALLDEIAAPDASGLTLLRDAADALALSARGYHRTLRVARTLADLDGEARVARIHVAEALSYRGETLRRAQAAASGEHIFSFFRRSLAKDTAACPPQGNGIAPKRVAFTLVSHNGRREPPRPACCHKTWSTSPSGLRARFSLAA
jgi:hypothetical protein